MTDLVFARGSESPIYLYRTLNYSGQKKIQGFLDSCAEHGLDISQKNAFSAPGDLHKACSILEQLDADGISFDCVLAADDEPVSYTHLDVYKRQQQIIPHQFHQILIRINFCPILHFYFHLDLFFLPGRFILQNAVT